MGEGVKGGNGEDDGAGEDRGVGSNGSSMNRVNRRVFFTGTWQFVFINDRVFGNVW